MGGICCAEGGGQPVESVSTMEEGTAEAAAPVPTAEEGTASVPTAEESAAEAPAAEEAALEEAELEEAELEEETASVLPVPEEEEEEAEEENPLEELKVELLFQVPDGEQKLVEVPYRPLGVGFTMTAPLSVKAIRPGSMGEEMKIMPQWNLLEINGENVSEMSCEEALQMLAQAFELLPEKPSEA